MSLADALRGEDYPCRYPFKLVCRPDALDDVKRAIRAALPADAAPEWRQRASRNGNYIALTVTIRAESAAQIEAVYAALAPVPGIVTSL